MLIPYIGETGALIVATVMFIAAPLIFVAFVRWGTRPVRRQEPQHPTAVWRRVDQPWSED